jgi:hypothetical protein
MLSQRMVEIQLTEDRMRLNANVLNSNRSISEVIDQHHSTYVKKGQHL